MTGPDVVVVGGCGIGLSFTIPRAIHQGETLIATGLSYVTGGKAANQAVGLGTLGMRAYLLSAIGDDAFGREVRSRWEARGVLSDAVDVVPDEPTMVGALQVTDAGENNIVLYPGALARLTADRVRHHSALIAQSDCVIVSLEIPTDAARTALALARDHGVLTILNPSPAPTRRDWLELAPHVDLVVVNAMEAAHISEAEHPDQQVSTLLADGAREVIMTLGPDGARRVSSDEDRVVPGVPVEARDTSGAGDGFLSAYAAARVSGLDEHACLTFAAEAAAEIVQGTGFVEALDRWDDAGLAARLRVAAVRPSVPSIPSP